MKINDKVKTTDGKGPIMTVEKIKGAEVLCFWWVGKEKKTASFSKETVEPFKEQSRGLGSVKGLSEPKRDPDSWQAG